uniref:Uncharacterized protein n=1 Tax=Aegilops tauschii subsp. strangulata TaxID=200361 RepID=A0A453MC57_AEGTS
MISFLSRSITEGSGLVVAWHEVAGKCNDDRLAEALVERRARALPGGAQRGARARGGEEDLRLNSGAGCCARRRRPARHRIERRAGWGASLRLGSGGEGERRARPGPRVEYCEV